MPEPEVRHLISYLFGGEDGAAMAARIDRRIDTLPGLSGLGLVAKGQSINDRRARQQPEQTARRRRRRRSRS